MQRTGGKNRKIASDLSFNSQFSSTWNISRCSSLSDPDNDYLRETRRIASLSEDIRREIERRFHKSRTNVTYVFPRCVKLQNAPNPSLRPRIPSVQKLQVENEEIRRRLKTKSPKSVSHSRNTSFARLNESAQGLLLSNASLNSSFQGARDLSLTKKLPRNQPVRMKASMTRPRIQKPAAVLSLHRRPESRSVLKPKPRKTPLSLDTSLMLKPAHSKPFLSYERMY